MAGLAVELRGLRILSLKLQRAANRIGNFGELHRRVGIRMLAWIHQNFRVSGLERPWAPLAPNTILARRLGGGRGGARPLRNTGGLEGSFSYTATDTEAVVGAPGDLARWHHRGVRPFGPIRPRTKKALAFVAVGGGIKKPGTTRRLLRAEKTQRKFTDFRLAGRSKKDFARLPFVVVSQVKRHPGIPARPLVPSDRAALGIALQVGRAWVREHLQELGGT